MYRYRDPSYMNSYATGFDPYYSAIHAYSQEVARSAKEEIEKQAEDLRNFRKVMLGEFLVNIKLQILYSRGKRTTLLDEFERLTWKFVQIF